MAERAALELSGIAADGTLDRVLVVGPWIVPTAVDVDGDVLRWQLHEGEPKEVGGYPYWPSASSASPLDILDRFCGLADAPPSRVAAFARRWGLLSLPADADGFYLPDGTESLEAWRTLTSDALAALEVAAHLRQGERPPDELWASFRSFSAVPLSADKPWVEMQTYPTTGLDWGALATEPSLLGEAEQVIASFVSAWLTGVSLHFVWELNGAPSVVLSPGGLVGALGLQLAQAVVGTKGLATCKGCARFFAPPHRNRRWCDSCRDDRGPQRAAEQRYRQRQQS